MPINILMPALSPTMEKGNLSKWLKQEGDSVKSGDVIAEIETDKATMEVEAADDGTLGKILVPEGTNDVAVNTPIAVILAEDHRDRLVHLDALRAFGNEDAAERAFVGGLHLHGGLVGLDFGEHIARLHLIAFLLVPLGEVALGHRRRERRHQYLDRHRVLPTQR